MNEIERKKAMLQEKLVKRNGCHVLCDTKVISKKKWLGIRKGFLNGTDAGKIAGVCKWGSPLSVYLDKTLPETEKEEPDNWFKLECGLQLEPLVAKWYAKATGYQVEPVDYMLQHPVIPYIAGDMDYIAETPAGELIGIEIKTTDEINVVVHEQFKAGILGEDGLIPAQYEYQVRHYMAVTGLNRFIVLICYGFDHTKVIPVMVYRDLEKEAAMLQMEAAFWTDHILARIQPEADMSREDLKAIQKAQFNLEAQCVELPEEARDVLQSYQDLVAQKKSCEDKTKEIEPKINALMAEIIRLSQGAPSARLPIDEDSYYEVVNKIGSRTLADTTKLKLAFPEVYEQVKKTCSFEQTTVRIKKNRAAGKGGVK